MQNFQYCLPFINPQNHKLVVPVEANKCAIYSTPQTKLRDGLGASSPLPVLLIAIKVLYSFLKFFLKIWFVRYAHCQTVQDTQEQRDSFFDGRVFVYVVRGL